MLALFFIFACCVAAQPISVLEDKKFDQAYIKMLVSEAFRLEDKRLKSQNANPLQLLQNKKNYELLLQEALKKLHLGTPRENVSTYLANKKLFFPKYEHPVQNPISKDLKGDLEEVPFSPEERSSSFYSSWISL